ncbi:hypothetical protein WDU94_010903, partial [Cyamophila willieti]
MCDLSRAFECLSHQILLSKLKHYKFDAASINMLTSYLEGRSQQVRVGDQLSQSRNVTIGIPTGSITGPLLFLLYINDLPANLPGEADGMLFADDSTLFVHSDSEHSVLSKSEQVLERAQVWFHSNRLHLNHDKTHHITFTLRRINDTDNPKQVKLLGFLLDPHLTWQPYIDYVSNKLAGRLFLLRRLRAEVSPSTLKTAYYGTFHSILSYGLLLWGHSASSQQLFIMQKKAIRILDHKPPNSHAKPSFTKLEILTIPSLYILQCLMHVKNNIHLYPSQNDIHAHNTRNSRDLVLSKHRVNKAQNGPNHFGILFYNKLPSYL